MSTISKADFAVISTVFFSLPFITESKWHLLSMFTYLFSLFFPMQMFSGRKTHLLRITWPSTLDDKQDATEISKVII